MASTEGQTPSPSTSNAMTSASQTQTRLSKPPTTVSEWQLLAILHRANLLQYYDVFIDKGGDDVNQIMCSEESEFLEIMSIVGMLSKPLHVRRLQRALAQYSNDPTAFNVAAIPQIGPPPVSSYPLLGATDPVQLFNPASLSALTSGASASSTSTVSTTTVPTTTCSIQSTIDAVAAPSPLLHLSTSSSPTPSRRQPPQSSGVPPIAPGSIGTLSNILSNIGATANVMTGDYLTYLMETNQHTDPSPSPLHDDYVALGDFDPNSDSNEMPVLSDAQINRLAACSAAAVAKVTPRQPKLVQNKKKISQDIVDLMTMQPTNPARTDEFRKFAAIYGRFDAKRKADKVLTLHEVSVNEAAAQICMLVPALLTRRDELFALSRQVVKDAGYHYTKSSATGQPRLGGGGPSRDRKRMKSETPTEGATSPRSQESGSPQLNVVDEDPLPSTSSGKRPKISPSSGATKSLLDRWAAEKIAKTDGPGPSGL